MAKFKGIKSAFITLTFEAESVQGGRDFQNVQEFAEFLREESDIAKLLGCSSKP